MKEQNKNAFEAINKFMYFSWNYKMCEVKAHTKFGGNIQVIVPEFIKEVKWTFGMEHAINKWQEANRGMDSTAYVPSFYKELDETNKQLFVEWVLENYRG